MKHNEHGALEEGRQGAQRLHVYLAHAGVASRRECERIIVSGRVKVNGVPVSALGLKVSSSDSVLLDGVPVYKEDRLLYLAMHKPEGYLCTQTDPFNRPLARGLLPSEYTERLYTVGRLDFHSSGLLFWTNDGAFAAALGHPSSCIEKEYYVEAAQPVPDALLSAFKEGIEVEKVWYQCVKIERLSKKSIRLVLIEGKNREIRRVFSHFHLHPVVLRRERIGPVLLGNLLEGKTRSLSKEDMEHFGYALNRSVQKLPPDEAR